MGTIIDDSYVLARTVHQIIARMIAIYKIMMLSASNIELVYGVHIIMHVAAMRISA